MSVEIVSLTLFFDLSLEISELTYGIKITQSVTCNDIEAKRSVASSIRVVSGVSVFVSAEGRVRGTARAHATYPGATDLTTLLGIADLETIRRLSDATYRAVHKRSSSSLRWRTSHDIIGKIISVHRARETGFAIVTVTDLDAPAGNISIALLMDIFELTRAEAEIAASLFCKSDLSDIARERGVQLETVRGQVKAILHKVGTASQKQLMLVLSRMTQISLASESPPSFEPLQLRAAKTG